MRCVSRFRSHFTVDTTHFRSQERKRGREVVAVVVKNRRDPQRTVKMMMGTTLQTWNERSPSHLSSSFTLNSLPFSTTARLVKLKTMSEEKVALVLVKEGLCSSPAEAADIVSGMLMSSSSQSLLGNPRSLCRCCHRLFRRRGRYCLFHV